MSTADALHRLLFPVGPRQRTSLLASAPSQSPEETFLALHRGFARALAATARARGARGEVLSWIRLESDPDAAALLWSESGDRDETSPGASAFPWAGSRDTGVLTGDLGEAYARTLDPDLRHRLGEHYTPMWLVRRVTERFAGGGMTADPACGDGRFIVAMLDAGHPPEDLWAADLNPLAVMMARINVWDRLGRPTEVPRLPVIWGDFVLAGGDAPPGLTAPAKNVTNAPVADAYIGNPPWVTWRNLSDGYRAAVASRLASSRLHHTRGWSARVSAGQTDLAHVFVHHAAERVGRNGRIGFVLPRTVFKAPVGPSRVREGVTTSGRAYHIHEIWDCATAAPFTGVRLDAVVALAIADRAQEFPVPWIGETGTGQAVLSDPDDPASPWLTPHEGADQRPLQLASGVRWAALRGRGGINTGGGNGAFYVQVLSERDDTMVIRNVPSRRQPTVEVTAEVERAFVRPLLRGKDIRAWDASPSGHVVLPHTPEDLRRPMPDADLARVAPRTYAYLLHFKDLLANRKELRRWPSESWYTLFRIGPYTAGSWRVVWPHSGNGRLRAAVLAPEDPTVPDQKVVLVAFAERAPALFLAALLNSTIVGAAAANSAGLDASPNLVRRLVLPRFEPDRPDHQRIVTLAEGALGNAAQTGVDAAVTLLYAQRRYH